MVKHSKKNTGKKIVKKQVKSHKHLLKMVGGDFSNDDRNELLQLGFVNEDVELLEHNIPNMNLIRMSLQQINPETGVTFTAEELMQGLHDAMNETMENDELNLSGISNASDDEHNIDEGDFLDNSFMSNPDSMETTRENISNLNNTNNSNISLQSNGSLHLSDLNDSNSLNVSSNTTKDEETFGGKKYKKKAKKYSHKKGKNKKGKKTRKYFNN